MAEYTAQQLLDIVNTAHVAQGNPPVRQTTQRIVTHLFRTI